MFRGSSLEFPRSGVSKCKSNLVLKERIEEDDHSSSPPEKRRDLPLPSRQGNVLRRRLKMVAVFSAKYRFRHRT